MDSSYQQALFKRFTKMVDKPNLKSEFPEQFSKHWENKGRSGIVRIIQAGLLNEPCELKFSLFFDGDEVIQTGVQIKFQQEQIVNEVRKGDVLDYKDEQRVDIVAFLKKNYASVSPDGLPREYTSESYALEIDDDAEPVVWRAVLQLTGKSEEELKAIWDGLVTTNHLRSFKDQVSPIIKTWLKKERDRLDMQYLQDARILHPREKEVSQFVTHERFYTVISKGMSGDVIREKIDSTDPEWWGGMFYAYVNTVFSKVPHDPRDRLTFLDQFDPSAPFLTEEIFVDNRHIYSVVYVANDEALVFRTRNQVSAESHGIFQPAPEHDEPGRTRKLMDRLTGKSPQAGETALDVEESSLPAAHPYLVLRAERAYLEALHARSPALSEKRRDCMTLLYDSDPSRFRGNPDDLLAELDVPISKLFRKKPAALERERRLLNAHTVIFYDEREGQ